MQITSETVRGRVESDHAVIGFKQERLREQEDVERIFEEIAAALPDRGLRVLVLDFAGVMSVASNFLGKLVMLHKKLAQRGTVLRACAMAPDLYGAFSTCKLQKLIPVSDTEAEALA